MLNLRESVQNSPRKVSLFCQFCCTFAFGHEKGRTASKIYLATNRVHNASQICLKP